MQGGAGAKKSSSTDNYNIAVAIMKARRKGEKAFPSTDIAPLVEMALAVVATNFKEYPELYPELKSEDPKMKAVHESITRLIDPKLPITVTARNVDYEFYWEKKCKDLKNCKKEDHGGSYKQAFIERSIEDLLEK